MIEVVDFTKIYHLSKKQMTLEKTKNKTKLAVENVSFTAKKGRIFGLLGPNGAGKTTTLRTIATLLKPTEGKIKVNGYDVEIEPIEVRRRIGFLTNELKMEAHFTPLYTMHFFGKLHGLKKEQIDNRIEELFSYFGIHDFKDKKVAELSTGMTQKLAIAVSLVHDPEVVIFDEPTNGLDIITAKAVIDYLERLKEAGKTIIISTHIMAVAEKLCDQVAIIINGKKIIEGTIPEILISQRAENLETAFFSLYEKMSKGDE